MYIYFNALLFFSNFSEISILLPPHSVSIDLHGDLAGILGIATLGDRPLIEGVLSYFNRLEKQGLGSVGLGSGLNSANKSLSRDFSQEALVAGVGFEPTTFRL